MTLISDDPAKAVGRAAPSALLITRLGDLLAPRRQLDLVSGYFVPTTTTVRVLSALAARGASVSVVTNSYEATDVPVVHAGYAGDRKALLKAGIRLWEIRGDSSAQARRSVIGSGGSGVPGSSGQALHAKTFTADGERLFVRLVQPRPRSARLNTELGFVIGSPVLTERVDNEIAAALPREALEVRLSAAGELVWIEHRGKTAIRHDVEPGTTWLSRLFIAIVSMLPVEWLL